jgi:biopolymer transport protein ExbB
MLSTANPVELLQVLLEAGGPVMAAIMAVAVLMWLLILERYWYLFSEHPQRLDRYLQHWHQQAACHHWQQDKMRMALISDLGLALRNHITTIKTLIAVCPLLGLLGTVMGMIDVFDVLAVMGTGNARAMASGISHATIPTMAGMVVALSGLFFSTALDRRARVETARVVDCFCIAPAIAHPRSADQ